MNTIIKWFVNNGVVANLLMIFILLSGALTIPLLKMEIFPELDLNIINVSAVYPGASPSDVEEASALLRVQTQQEPVVPRCTVPDY